MKSKYLLVTILLSATTAIPYFATNDLLHTHDGLVHLARLAAYFKALSELSIPVRFAGYLNYGYGLPLFNFIYHFPYWVGSLFLLLGVGLVNAFKLSIILSFILSGITMYLFSKEYFESEKKAFITTLLYQFAPFRMVELIVRGSYGEVYTYVFLPLVLFGLTLILRKKFVPGYLATALGVFFLIISHNSVSLIFFGACALFVLFAYKKIKHMFVAFSALLLGMVMSSFYWVPAILDHKYTYGNLFMEQLYKEHFAPIQNFFIPNLTNSSGLWTGGISTYIGFFQTIALILAVYLIVRKKIKDDSTKRILYFSLLIFVLSFFMMTPFSSFLWGNPSLSFLRQFQFPWRFLSLIVLSLSLLSVSFPIIYKKLLNKWQLTLLTLGVFLCIVFYLKPHEGYQKINENYYWNFPLNTTYYGETDVIWSAGPAKNYPKNRVEVINGKGTVTNLTKKNSYQTFKTFSDEDIRVVSHTQYFPGWNAYVDGKLFPIQFQDPNNRGEITFDIPKGEHSVLVRFDETKMHLAFDILSIFGFVMLLPIVFLLKTKWIKKI